MSSVSGVTLAAPKRSSLRRRAEVIGQVLGSIVLLAGLGVTVMATLYYAQQCLASPHPTSNGKTACAVYQGQVICATFGSSRITMQSLPNKNTYIVLAVLFGLMALASLAGFITWCYRYRTSRHRSRAVKLAS